MANRASTTDDLRVKISGDEIRRLLLLRVGGGGSSGDTHARDAEDMHDARCKMVVMGGDAHVCHSIHG
ncbi:hypothetical protein CFC21_064750 [Triticum aestivum]|uniref:Uncharacterized protein n=3 Tax=Triticum TaxID=4564 RepID=A0A9R0TNK2_TRITD|nr:hypothetical protein CFC21_064750 [Triticum aestivum]VAI14442.1 unnamed protein product [Triticum turgidum subsp. durum]